MVFVQLVEGFRDANGYHVRVPVDWWCCIWLMVTYFRFGAILCYSTWLWTGLCNVLVDGPNALPVGFIVWLMLFRSQADLGYHWFAGLFNGFIVLSFRWPT